MVTSTVLMKIGKEKQQDTRQKVVESKHKRQDGLQRVAVAVLHHADYDGSQCAKERADC
jgi:hypothetical protein